MAQKIVFINDDNSIGIITPTAEWLESHTMEELAAKDVPAGKTYHIVDESEIPTDRTFRNAWEWA